MTDLDEEWAGFWTDKPVEIGMTLGVEPVDADDDHVALALPFRPEVSQATGVFAAGALIQLADMAATWLCLRKLGTVTDPTAPFAFSVQMNAHLVGNVASGRAIATAQLVSQGRSLFVVETRVRGDIDDRLLLLLTSTHVVRQTRTHTP